MLHQRDRRMKEKKIKYISSGYCASVRVVEV